MNDCIEICKIKAYLLDLIGFIPSIDVNDPPKLYVGAPVHFFHGESLILPFNKSSDFDVNGYSEIEIVETETPDQELQFFISIPEQYGTRIIPFEPARVPNMSECPLSKITYKRKTNMP